MTWKYVGALFLQIQQNMTAGLRDASEVGYGVMWIPSVHAEEHVEANFTWGKLSCLEHWWIFTSCRIIRSGTTFYVTKNKQASHRVTKQHCKRVDRFYNSVSILVCSSKLMKNRQWFWNTRQRISEIVASRQQQRHPADCASRSATPSG